jgi:hypothetical protein
MTDSHSNFLGGIAIVRAVLNSMDEGGSAEELEKEVFFLLGQNDGEIDTEIMVGILLGLASLSAGLVQAHAHEADVTHQEYLDDLTQKILLGGSEDE